MAPADAPPGTVAVICVGESSVKTAPNPPPNVTLVVPPSSLPVSTTDDPTAPLCADMDVMTGAAAARAAGPTSAAATAAARNTQTRGRGTSPIWFIDASVTGLERGADVTALVR